VGRTCDPVQERVMASGMPVHDCSVLTLDGWHASRLYLDVSRPFGLEHICTAPIVDGATVVGSLHVARSDANHPFDHDDLLAMAMLAAQVSVMVAQHRDRTTAALPMHLTGRQVDIVRLVSIGLANKEIGARLGISENTVKKVLKDVFRSAAVTSRAELSSLCARAGLL
jgi:DNA-binding CsgD family transcriptional regulator